MNAVGLNVPPQGTILPGTTIQLGKYTVIIDRYIAEGGFAHVYLATLANIGGFPVVVKRIAVADKERLAIVNKEIDIMKRLGKHKNLVEYMDSCMGKLEGGGYEVLILMEYCGGGSVIDLMNRRLQHRLMEPEILKIFSNVCEGVAYMHYSDPPILHRDIKVENILLSNNDYKLCDFGSATTDILRGENIPKNVKDIQLLEEEINNHTTLQYRAPEMIDLYMRKGIDEKIDIWALGVLLYKLCYYTTPFEEQGQLAILNVRYTIPDHPVFSLGLINLFKSMLKEDPKQRPNIYQVMKVTSALRGLPCPVQNIYPEISLSSNVPEAKTSATADILSNLRVTRPVDAIPSIEPMRRGRPTRAQGTPTAAPSTTSPASQGNNFASGFDDSFGDFAPVANPAAQFSKIPPTGDAFDFDSPKQADTRRFTLELDNAGKDEFGFNFQTSTNQSSAAPVSSSRPRPPSFSGPDLLHPEPQSSGGRINNVKNTMPSQLSGASNGVSGKAKPTADDLFFGSSAGIQFENGDFGSRSGTPSSFGSMQQTPIGVSSPSSINGSQFPGVSKPLLPPRQSSQPSDQSSSSAKSYTDRDSAARGPRPANSTGSSSEKAKDPLSASMERLALLQRQQMEQLGRFNADASAPAGPQTSQGKPKAVDPSRTLDGMKSGLSSGSPSIASPAPAPRPLVAATASPVPRLDKSELVQKDLDSELKLLQLQQKEFERQQQELLSLQRRQLDEQQRLHRQQQEQLQKQQQQQIQQQHEKWQERKRMLKEQEQLAHTQAMQQRDLQQQHESQKLQQQQQQRQPLIDISNQTASIASLSLGTTNVQQQMLSGASSGYSPSIAHQKIGGSDHYSTLASGRASMDEQDRYRSNAYPAHSSPVSSQSPSSVPQSVPVKSPRRNGANGNVSSTTTPTSASARRTSMSQLPPGQKPDLLPKPTRFRMKDGTGTLVAGEEEAFKKKFPSADMDEDLIQLQQPSSRRDIVAGVSSYGRASPSPAGSYSADSAQYMSPSRRAREARVVPTDDQDEEEEEETLVRSRRRPYKVADTNAKPLGTSSASGRRAVEPQDDDEDEATAESVRERVQRMNRVGRIV
ncbi:hypothetical protein BGZ99_004438 [Dissophora globulifera]|uniref:non-specific serine/threonine protein kinase n=1 Tax=Dissophora globulifera TaxID=979702 RepID=A0A9P6RIN4_9FUNG|nr:hypothetical protein BGZ99_004438 [Dissophora globulifera]